MNDTWTWEQWQSYWVGCLAKGMHLNRGELLPPCCAVCGTAEVGFQALHCSLDSSPAGVVGYVVAFHCRDCSPEAAKRAVCERVPAELEHPDLAAETSPKWRFTQGDVP